MWNPPKHFMSLHLVIGEVMHTVRNCKGYKLISQSCDPGISDDGPKNAHDHMCTFKNLIFCIKNVYVYVPVMCTVDMVYSVLQSFISSGFVHTISQMSFFISLPNPCRIACHIFQMLWLFLWQNVFAGSCLWYLILDGTVWMCQISLCVQTCTLLTDTSTS